MGKYTDELEYKSFEFDYVDEMLPEEVAKRVVEFLNEIESFRSFGDGLKYIMSKKYPQFEEKIKEMPETFIRECCSQNNVPEKDICESSNTLSNWFKSREEKSGVKEGGPKGGVTNRKKLFALSFALDLNIEETKYLFHNIYFDRAFDLKNINELIYYYCKKNNKSWVYAKELIKKVDSITSEQTNNRTILTKLIKEDIDKTKSEEQLLEYISEHIRDLNKKNATAKEALQIQKEIASATAKKEAKKYSKGEKKHRCGASMAFTLFMILDRDVSNKKGTISLFGKNANIRDSLKSNFPEASKLNKKELNYEEIRKIIILLFSYHTWYEAKEKNEDIDIDKYIDELDDILFDSGLSKLYYGNPYDWLFLFCTLDKYDPLLKFRNIIGEILDKDDINEFSKLSNDVL